MPIFDKFPTFFMYWMKIAHLFLIRSKEPPIFNLPTLDSAKYFYKMAVTAGLSCGEMGLNSQKKNCHTK